MLSWVKLSEVKYRPKTAQERKKNLSEQEREARYILGPFSDMLGALDCLFVSLCFSLLLFVAFCCSRVSLLLCDAFYLAKGLQITRKPPQTSRRVLPRGLDHPRPPQDHPKTPQDPPQTTPRPPKIAQDDPENAQDRSKAQI